MPSSDVTCLPKIELHLHIDNSISYEGLRRLKPSVSRDEYDRFYVAPSPCANLNQFLACVPKHLEVLQTVEGLQILVEDMFRQLEADGVVYAELRFAPLLHTVQGLSPERVVETVARATAAMSSASGIRARVILCTLRHFSERDSMTTVRLAADFRQEGVAALDLAGDEAGFPLGPHAAAYDYAREHDLPTTAHAGEALGAPSVWETLRLLQPQRIGHGVRSSEDPALVRHLQRNGIHLEICPSSNVQIVESIQNWSAHPVDRLYRAGVSLNINTDTRALTPTTLKNEYARMQEHFGWSAADFLAANLAAVDHAFVDEDTRAALRKHLTEAYRPALVNQ